MTIRKIFTAALIAATSLSPIASAPSFAQQQAPAKRPNILVIFGDDIGQSNISAYTMA
jgi:hypothetical protein